MSKQVEFLIHTIFEVWKKYNLGTVNTIALKAGVTRQTVRNVKNGTSTNPKVLLYMISTILWELELNSWKKAQDARVTEREVKEDREEVLVIISTLTDLT